MKNIFSPKSNYSIRVIYHFFAITGVVSSLFFVVSWSDAKLNKNDSAIENMERTPDVNVSPENATAFINAFKGRFVREGSEAPPKGYFITKAAINWLLENESLNGIYVYPAVNAEGVVCAVIEGGVSANATHAIMEGVAGRVIMSASPCPNDCGSLAR
jgi:hypothetical protein